MRASRLLPETRQVNHPPCAPVDARRRRALPTGLPGIQGRGRTEGGNGLRSSDRRGGTRRPFSGRPQLSRSRAVRSLNTDCRGGHGSIATKSCLNDFRSAPEPASKRAALCPKIPAASVLLLVRAKPTVEGVRGDRRLHAPPLDCLPDNRRRLGEKRRRQFGSHFLRKPAVPSADLGERA